MGKDGEVNRHGSAAPGEALVSQEVFPAERQQGWLG